MPSAITPLITFKAGLCEVEGNDRPLKVFPRATKGYVYLYMDESELLKLCWRERTSEPDEAELELIMPPADATFLPYKPHPSHATSKANGRFFVLRFESSSERHFFWMQSKPQHPEDPSSFSARDLKIGDVVNRMLQGEEVDAAGELAAVNSNTGGGGSGSPDEDEDGDETMEDAEGTRGQHNPSAGGAGGAGADATGGDVRQEGESSREGGADGARAATSSSTGDGLSADASVVVQNFLASLRGSSGLGGGGQRGVADKPYPHLTHLLTSDATVPMIEAASEDYIDNLLGLLPSTVVVLATGAAGEDASGEPTPDAAQAAMAALSLFEKRTLLKRVLRSPQFQQALAALTMAIREGGLPGIAGALGIPVDNGGRLQGSGMPLGGGEALEAFVDGVRKSVGG